MNTQEKTKMKILGIRMGTEEKSDEDHVAEVRRTVESWQRGRPWVIGLNIGILLLVILLLGPIVNRLAQFGINLPAFPGVQVVWLTVGLLLGQWGSHCLHSLAEVIDETTAGRTNRLLVQYFDAYQKLANADDGDLTSRE